MKFDRSIVVTLKDGNTYGFEDSYISGSGTAAYNQILAKQTIHSKESNEGLELYIPFHAIKFAVLAVEGQEIVLVDSNCVSESLEPAEPTNPGFVM